ncbi:lysophospholipase [Photobacterium sanctipauli]|uniref:Lysophospholipase n=1 Tax=Photobacterium sanctipauli TaxID=1342794 RepID=A0A2T3NZ83_9GAMM|nr:lysophospholipase [Photobacterium sanctipauli]
MTGAIHHMWLQRNQGVFAGAEGVPIRWISVTDAGNQACVVLVNGRNESFWKYQELIYELSHQGFDVYAFDHRGQGASGRLTSDPELGHIGNFDNYILDLNTFISDVVKPERYPRRYLMAHSMGGAVTTLYLARFTPSFHAVVLNAPMFGIQLPMPLKRMAVSMTKLIDRYQTKPTYAFGQHPYSEEPFEANEVSQSTVRFSWSKRLYNEYPELRLGGPSSRWVWQALKAGNQCLSNAARVKVPVLLLQAGCDSLVDNRAQYRFARKLEGCEMRVIADARHELLMEKDEFRNQVLNETMAFFQRHT